MLGFMSGYETEIYEYDCVTTYWDSDGTKHPSIISKCKTYILGDKRWWVDG